MTAAIAPQEGSALPKRESVNNAAFNRDLRLPFRLRLDYFASAVQDAYNFFFDVNKLFDKKGLPRLDDYLRPAILSGMLSDMMTASPAANSRTLVQNAYFNGHPDLIIEGRYPDNAFESGIDGVEIKTTRKPGGAVDTHGARDQWMCVFIYKVDRETQPARDRNALRFTEIYLAKVEKADYRKNARGEIGT